MEATEAKMRAGSDRRGRSSVVARSVLALLAASASLPGLTSCRRNVAGGTSSSPGPVDTAATGSAATGTEAEVPLPSLARGLPSRAGAFVAEVAEDGVAPSAPGPDGAVHAVFTRGTARIHVTLASFPFTDQGWSSWLSASAAFPQARLPWPADVANGFYQCDEATPPHCDLLIQFRAGHHLELRGGTTSRRADVDDLSAGLAATF